MVNTGTKHNAVIVRKRNVNFILAATVYIGIKRVQPHSFAPLSLLIYYQDIQQSEEALDVLLGNIHVYTYFCIFQVRGESLVTKLPSPKAWQVLNFPSM